MATEIIKGKLLGIDRIGDDESALVIEIRLSTKQVFHKNIPAGGFTITPDWVVGNMGQEVECLVVNGVLQSVQRS